MRPSHYRRAKREGALDRPLVPAAGQAPGNFFERTLNGGLTAEEATELFHRLLVLYPPRPKRRG